MAITISVGTRIFTRLSSSVFLGVVSLRTGATPGVFVVLGWSVAGMASSLGDGEPEAEVMGDDEVDACESEGVVMDGEEGMALDEAVVGEGWTKRREPGLYNKGPMVI